jgi:GTP-binding protein HflX
MDGSSPQMERQKEIVYGIFDELGAGKIPVLEVVNKIDISDNSKVHNDIGNRLSVSAVTGEGIPELINKIEQAAEGIRMKAEVHVPYERGALISYIHENTEVLSMEYENEYINFKLKLTKRSHAKILSELS